MSNRFPDPLILPHLHGVGYVRSAHGIRGEIYVHLFAARADWLEDTSTFTLARPKFLEPSEFAIEEARPHKEGLIVSLKGVVTRDAAEALKGAHVYVPEGVLVSEPGETVYLRELEGFALVDAGGVRLGKVIGFSSNGPQDLLQIDTGQGRALVPFVEAFLLNIDFDKREIQMDLPPGLIDLEEKS